MPPSRTIVIVGGGPAGLMAAIAAAESGARAILLEKNARTGVKLSITGKGRCNITNTADIEEIVRNVPDRGKFLYSCLHQFSNRDLVAWLHSELGVETVVERGGRVFPASDDAKAVAAALADKAERAGVGIRVRSAVRTVRAEAGAVRAVVLKDGSEIPCDAAVLATGGVSYPGTGSTGDGYAIAETLGHRIVAPEPSLVPLRSDAAWVGKTAGLSLRNVAVVLRGADGRPVYKDFGEMLFTHDGVSGPVVLSASRHVREADGPMTLSVDLKPALDPEKLDARILRDLEAAPNKAYRNALDELLPRSLIPAVVALSGIDPDKPVHQISREERRRLGALLKDLRIPIAGRAGFEEAIVTKGGVDTAGIEPGTMASKIVKGLYFAGEIIDVDGYTGGYNLTIAFSTGRCAGKNAALHRG